MFSVRPPRWIGNLVRAQAKEQDLPASEIVSEILAAYYANEPRTITPKPAQQELPMTG